MQFGIFSAEIGADAPVQGEHHNPPFERSGPGSVVTRPEGTPSRRRA
jgi:hypothetical protein